MPAFRNQSDVRLAMLLLVGLAVSGCAKTDETSMPEVALGDQPGAFMPPGRPAIDLSLISDQTSVSLVKKVEIKYGPLKRGSDEDKSVGAPDSKGRKQAKKPAAPAEEEQVATAEPAKPRKRTKIGAALSDTMGLLSGRRGMALAAPRAPGEPVDDVPKPAAAGVRLVDPHGSAAEIPPPPDGVSPDQANNVRAAARADAVKNLMKAAYALPLGPGTVGDAIGQPPEEFPDEPEGVNVFAARWTENQTLEVEVEITVGQLLTALTATFEDVDFEPLKSLDPNKAIAARGKAQVPGAKPDEPGGKKPAPKRPLGKGGGMKA